MRILFLIMMVWANTIFAQTANYGKTWVHGSGYLYKTSFNGVSDTSVFWNPSTTVPSTFSLRGKAANICDANGNPIIVTNGYSIWDGNSNLMDNGDSICYAIDYANGLPLEQMQRSIILPVGDSIYYVFTTALSDSVASGAVLNPGYDRLLYAVVDMKANNYAGKVVSKRNIVLKDSALAITQMTAVRHGNGTDWWLVKRGLHGSPMDSSIFYVYRVKKDSIIGPIIQTFPALGPTPVPVGQCVFNHQGTKFAAAGRSARLILSDFDRCTGLFSNLQDIVIDPVTTNCAPFTLTDSLARGVAFSPNDSLLYICVEYGIAQYQVYAPDVRASQQVIGGPDTCSQPFSGRAFGGLYTAPNGKIYACIAMANTGPWSVIEYPNQIGLASGFCGRCKQFPFWQNYPTVVPRQGPNMPNYGLGPVLPNACMPFLSAGIVSTSRGIRLYPNPTSGQLTLEDEGRGGVLTLQDMLGRQMWQGVLSSGRVRHELDWRHLPTGTYLCSYQIPGGIRQQGKLVIGD